MQNSEVHTQNDPFVKSPISKSFDQGIDTPPKFPVAPHPSPINMDTESSNPKSKEVFRTELLKACLLKIPEAVADESVFNDYLVKRTSSTCEDEIPDLADGLQGECVLRLYKKSKLESDCVTEDEIPANLDTISIVKDKVNLVDNPDESTSANIIDFGRKNECPRNFSSYHLGNSGRVEPPYINVSTVDSIDRKNGVEQFHDYAINRVAFYDHSTDHYEISRLLNVNSECIEHSDSISGGRSPSSDNLSTVAVCASDVSDISDDDISTRSMDLCDMERSTDRPSNPNKKKSRSAVRRFLNWRRCLKFRKRAASLDESRFPFLANRFDSYKTEFELSV